MRVITLPEYDVRDYVPPENVYGILAAPPCTEFSMARNGHPQKIRNYPKAMEIVIACLKIIWNCRYKNKLAFWALENPTGILRQFLGKPTYTFQPWFWGDMYRKSTDLWGYFNIPKQKYFDKPAFGKKHTQSCLGDLPPVPENYVIPKGVRKDAVARAITPPGFAKAFFEANR